MKTGVDRKTGGVEGYMECDSRFSDELKYVVPIIGMSEHLIQSRPLSKATCFRLRLTGLSYPLSRLGVCSDVSLPLDRLPSWDHGPTWKDNPQCSHRSLKVL